MTVKRVILSWNTQPLSAAGFRPLEEFTWHVGITKDALGALITKADAERCGYVGEGEGMGTTFTTIAEALAYADFKNDVVINRDDALAEQARRRGWTRRGTT